MTNSNSKSLATRTVSVEYWEFFDATVPEAVIYDNHLDKPLARPSNPLGIFANWISSHVETTTGARR